MNASWNGRHEAAPGPRSVTLACAWSSVTDASDARSAATCDAMRWSRITRFMNWKHRSASGSVATCSRPETSRACACRGLPQHQLARLLPMGRQLRRLSLLLIEPRTVAGHERFEPRTQLVGCDLGQLVHRQQRVLHGSSAGLRRLADGKPGRLHRGGATRAVLDRPVHRACAADRELEAVAVLEVEALDLLVVLGPVLLQHVPHWQEDLGTAGVDQQLGLEHPHAQRDRHRRLAVVAQRDLDEYPPKLRDRRIGRPAGTHRHAARSTQSCPARGRRGGPYDAPRPECAGSGGSVDRPSTPSPSPPTHRCPTTQSHRTNPDPPAPGTAAPWTPGSSSPASAPDPRRRHRRNPPRSHQPRTPEPRVPRRFRRRPSGPRRDPAPCRRHRAPTTSSPSTSPARCVRPGTATAG